MELPFLISKIEGEAVKQYEKLKVYVRQEKGHTVCICLKAHKGCKRHCQEDVVIRDRFAGWQGTMKRNKYGI